MCLSNLWGGQWQKVEHVWHGTVLMTDIFLTELVSTHLEESSEEEFCLDLFNAGLPLDVFSFLLSPNLQDKECKSVLSSLNW